MSPPVDFEGRVIISDPLATHVAIQDDENELVTVRTLIDRDTATISGIGIQGPQGPIGPPGSYYEHVQGSASDTWTVNHDLDKFPSVNVNDSGGNIIEGDVVYLNRNSLLIYFIGATSGTATAT